METIMAALVSGGFSVIAIIITSVISQRKFTSEMKASSELSDQKLDSKIDKIEAVTGTKIEQLTREVRAHNNFALKVPVIEQRLTALEEKIEKL